MKFVILSKHQNLLYKLKHSFPGLVGSACLLNALADRSITSVGIFAIATSNMGQLVRICFPVHGVWEVLPV